MAINSPEWNAVRLALASAGAERDGLNEAEIAFVKIEADVERLMQETTSLQQAERELRAALEEPAGAETQRR